MHVNVENGEKIIKKKSSTLIENILRNKNNSNYIVNINIINRNSVQWWIVIENIL